MNNNMNYFRFALVMIILIVQWSGTSMFTSVVGAAVTVGGSGGQSCNGTSSECVGAETTTLESDELNDGRRSVLTAAQKKKRYISYDAMKRNLSPCNRRGDSYYSCGAPGRANPYRRGCSALTGCHRYTD